MSLPSYAISYDKNGVELHREHINVGWYLNKEVWLECIRNQTYKVPNATLVEVYGIKFTPKWISKDGKYDDILGMLWDERQLAYFQKDNIDGHRDKIRIPSNRTQSLPGLNDESSKKMIVMIRKRMPQSFAEDIVGVQPMTEAGMIFSLRYRYGQNWYQRWYDYIKKIFTQGVDDTLQTTLLELKYERVRTEISNKTSWAAVQETIDKAYKERKIENVRI